MFGIMPAINQISKHTDKLWVVGLVAGAICGVSKGLYDRKNFNSISGFSRGVPKSYEDVLESNDKLPNAEKIEEEFGEQIEASDYDFAEDGEIDIG